jgi:hypothetical protein
MISVIIVNYHSENFIINCLETIIKYHDTKNIEIIIINNGGVIDKIIHKYPIVNVIDPKKNLGFSAANNLGFIHSKGDVILYLNPDTIFTSEVIHTCYKKLIEDTSIGLLGCKLLNKDMSLQLSYHNGHKVFKKIWYRNPLVIKLFNGSLKAQKSIDKIKIKHNFNHYAPWLSGAFMMLRRNDIIKHNLMWDNDFFMYWEDVELSFRVRSNNLKVFYFSDVSIVHIGGSGENAPIDRYDILERSKLLFIKKVYGRLLFLLYKLLIITELLFEYILYKRKKVQNLSSYNIFYKELLFYGIKKN